MRCVHELPPSQQPILNSKDDLRRLDPVDLRLEALHLEL